MSEGILVEIEPLCLELGSTWIKGPRWEFRLRRFQEEVIEFFGSDSTHPYLFLSAHTGSGKTFTLFSPLLSNILHGKKYDGALGIYPTKSLTVDQFESLRSTLEKLGGEARRSEGALAIYNVDLSVRRGCVEKGWRGSIGLVALTRDEIDKLRRGSESRRDVLGNIRTCLLREDVDYLVALAVPEYPYLMISGMYRSYHDLGKVLSVAAEGELVLSIARKMLSLIDRGDSDELGKLVRDVYEDLKPLVGGRVAERSLADLTSALLPPVLFFDEFHTWSFFELPTVAALVLLHRFASLLSVDRARYRMVFSSATPNSTVKEYLGRVLGASSFIDITASEVDCRSVEASKIRGKTEVELHPVQAHGLPKDERSWLLLDKKLRDVVEARSDEVVRRKRAIVLGRHPCYVEEAANTFREKTGFVPAVVTGVRPPPGFRGREELVEKKNEGDLYVFGNYAVELGVDLQNVTYGIVCAASLGELVQRVGRSGRGGVDSKVVVLVPENYLGDLKELGSRTSVTYSEFLKVMGRVMPDETFIRKLDDRATILYSDLGKLRLYLPLATYVLLLMRLKDKPADLWEVLSEFVRIAESTGIDRNFFSWLERRVFKNSSVLIEIASFRLSPTVPYAREGSQSQVDGEADPVTLLANYEARVDRSGGLRLIVREPARSSVKQMASIEVAMVDKDRLRSLHGAILPIRFLMEFIGGRRVGDSLLLQVLEEINVPVYVVYRYGEEDEEVGGGVEDSAQREWLRLMMEVLNAYGRAVKIHYGGIPYAYLLLL